MPPSQEPIIPSSTSKSPVLRRLQKITTAWSQCEPDRKFANKTFEEFVQATMPSFTTRQSLAGLMSAIKVGIATREIADTECRLLVKRAVAGVIANAAFGPNCALYRAMGYLLSDEKDGVSMELTIMDRLAKVISAWTECAPGVSFAGMTLEEFKTATEASQSARAALVAARTNYQSGIALRNAADAATLKLMNRAVASVIADEDFGNDSPLYSAMGYKRASQYHYSKRAPKE